MMRLILKQTKGNLLQSRSHLFVLILMSSLSSFMYFFVMFSVDGNLPKLRSLSTLSVNQEFFKIALESNTVLANNFLLALLLLTIFIFYMYWRQYFSYHLWELGFYKSNGISNLALSSIYIFISGFISLVGAIIGFIAAYFFSDILLKAYSTSYKVIPMKGITPSSILIGLLLPLLITCVISLIASSIFWKQDTSSLLKELDEKENNPFVLKYSNWIAKNLPFQNKEGARITLRRPLSLFLLFIAVMTLSIMFILSFSLNKSSSVIVRNQTLGRTYEYEVIYDSLQNISTNDVVFLQYKSKMQKQNSSLLNVSIIGIEENTLFTLLDKNVNPIPTPRNNQVIIGIHYANTYNYKVGDNITIFIGEKEKTFEVSDISANAESNTVYLSKATLEQWNSLHSGSYNRVFTNTKPVPKNRETIISSVSRKKQLELDAVSNKVSGVINQTVGCIIGIILIYLALLLSFQSSTSDIITLRMLGYSYKEIRKKLVDVYSSFIRIFFVVSLLPSCFIVRGIQRSLSIQTKDYMPFQFSTSAVFSIIIVLILIYTITAKSFTYKIKRYLEH